MSELIDNAVRFATEKHAGQTRKFTGIPYILHPMEVAGIIASLTTDENVIAAGLLHDTVEDCGVAPEEIRERFGSRVFALVCSETEDRYDNRPASETWMQRKQDSLLALVNTKDPAVRIMWLADKLSNLRSLFGEYLRDGDAIFEQLNQKDKSKQAWYYRSVLAAVPDLAGTVAYLEFRELVARMFGGAE